MPARVVEEAVGDSRQFLLNEFNSRYAFKTRDESLKIGEVKEYGPTIKWLHAFLAVVMGVMFVLICVYWGTESVVRLWNTAVVFEKPGPDGYVSRSMVLLQHLFGEHFCPGHDVATTPMYGVNAFPLALETSAKIDLWLLLLVVVMITGWLEFIRSNLLESCCGVSWDVIVDVRTPNDNPDLFRWLEYAVTSPLQVLVVAIAFHIRDVAQLATIGALQAALVIIGFSIEREIQLIGLNTTPWKSMLPMAVLFAVSLAGHVVVWTTIKQRSVLENKMALDCTYKNDADRQFFDDMSDVLDGIYGAEAALFSCFVPVPLFTLYLTIAGFPQDKVWHFTAQAYSVLSVMAKAALVIGFVFYTKSFGDTNPTDHTLNVTWGYNVEPIQLVLNVSGMPHTTPL